MPLFKVYIVACRCRRANVVEDLDWPHVLATGFVIDGAAGELFFTPLLPERFLGLDRRKVSSFLTNRRGERSEVPVMLRARLSCVQFKFPFDSPVLGLYSRLIGFLGHSNTHNFK